MALVPYWIGSRGDSGRDPAGWRRGPARGSRAAGERGTVQDPAPNPRRAVMTATATAARVLAWAAEPSGPPPAGPLWDVHPLASPPAAVRDAAGQLARQTAARLGAGAPPFGAKAADRPGRRCSSPPRPAAASRPAAAAALARAVPPAAARRNPGAWYDLVARHGLVSAAVTALDGTATGTGTTRAGGSRPHRAPPLAATRRRSSRSRNCLLDASPLTAVLYRPPLRALRVRHAPGRRWPPPLALLGPAARPGRCSRPGWPAGRRSPTCSIWRASLLTRLRHDHPDLLLDVYLTARTRFAADWDQRITWAARQPRPRDAPDPLAIATLRFWAPLAAVPARNAPLSRLRPLLSGQDRALTLVRRFRLDQAGAA